jgi:hypothetical protein
MKHISSAKKGQINEVTTHLVTKWNIPEGLLLTIPPLYRNFSIQTRAEEI